MKIIIRRPAGWPRKAPWPPGPAVRQAAASLAAKGFSVRTIYFHGSHTTVASECPPGSVVLLLPVRTRVIFSSVKKNRASSHYSKPSRPSRDKKGKRKSQISK